MLPEATPCHQSDIWRNSTFRPYTTESSFFLKHRESFLTDSDDRNKRKGGTRTDVP